MEKLADFLIEASSKLGVQATRIWSDLVKIVWIQCIFYSIIAVVTVTACCLGILFLTQTLNADDNVEHGWLGTIICIGVLSIVGIFALMTLGDNLPGVFFPEAKYVSFLVNKFAAAK